MPRKIINYNNTIIYKIVCNDLNITDLYVGSTTDFSNRKYNHKSNCNNEKNKNHNSKIYTTIRNNGGWINWAMIEIEKWPCNDRNEAQARERYWYDKLNSKLNTNIPFKSMDEYEEKNKEYYIKNKEKCKDYQNEYKEKNKEKTKYKYYLKKIKEMEKNDNIPTKYIKEYKKKANEYYELNKIKII